MHFFILHSETANRYYVGETAEVWGLFSFCDPELIEELKKYGPGAPKLWNLRHHHHSNASPKDFKQ